MKGYKGFKKGLICKGKQYAENTIFEENSAKICKSGMHFCKNPLDTLDYYPLINNDGELNEFAEVEALDEVQTDDDKKFVTKKLRVGARLDLSGFIKASIDFLFEHSKDASSGNSARLASSGDYCIIAGIGIKNKVKAALGSWIVLAEYDKNISLYA